VLPPIYLPCVSRFNELITLCAFSTSIDKNARSSSLKLSSLLKSTSVFPIWSLRLRLRLHGLSSILRVSGWGFRWPLILSSLQPRMRNSTICMYCCFMYSILPSAPPSLLTWDVAKQGKGIRLLVANHKWQDLRSCVKNVTIIPVQVFTLLISKLDPNCLVYLKGRQYLRHKVFYW